MPFTAQELENIANSTLDWYIREQPVSQTIQDKPLLNALWGKKRNFPGGKEFISLPVKGDYTSTLMGYTHDDQVTYSNPANVKRANYPWKELHIGIEMTQTELKKNGYSISDSLDGTGETEHSDAELIQLVDLFKDKIEDMMESWERDLNVMLWLDGTQSANEIPGVDSIVREAPATGLVGGLDSGLLAWWRNRFVLGITPSTANQTLTLLLETEYRQLRRYGGRPRTWFAGSSFLDALISELRAKGDYTNTGWASKGTDISTADVMFKGSTIEYDPTLDDLGKQKFCYVLDLKHISLRVMEGEEKKKHTPARPHDQYVLYRAITTTAGLIADQLNAHGVYSIA